jgi:mono/diheme cytochrome c family protein
MKDDKPPTGRWKKILLIFLVLFAGVGFVGWYKLFREENEPAFANGTERFKYGSITAENNSGLPYWVWLVLPRIFPEYLPGSGGYRSLGIVWEEGHEMPVGFTKKVVGFPRVANNCAVCHAASYRTKPDEIPTVIAAGPNHTSNIQAMLRFLTRCAQDPRFNSKDIMAEINQVTKLSWLDKILYKYLIIPRTRKALLKRNQQLAWMNRPNWPEWGPGRDDPMNLTKYFLTSLPIDDSTGQADMPSIWNLKIREGTELNWDGATPAVRSVLIDSGLGLGSEHNAKFLAQIDWLEAFLKDLSPPKYPLPVDEKLAAKGKPIYDATCASCHEAGPNGQMGKVVDISKIGTDRNRLDTWTQQAADLANSTVEKTRDPSHWATEDERLCASSDGWNMVARALSAQRVGTEHA